MFSVEKNITRTEGISTFLVNNSFHFQCLQDYKSKLFNPLLLPSPLFF